MCKKANKDSKVLKDRTMGLDSRGNRALNTQAETNWAIEALKGLDSDTNAQELITDELQRVYYDRKKLGFAQRTATKGFESGFEEYFGKYEKDKKTGQLQRVSPPKADPKPQDLINLMLESKYKFKDSVSWVADQVAEEPPGRQLRENARGSEVFTDRGRITGRKRKNSFVGPHAGIADHVFRPEGAENFFTREVDHAKGQLEGDPSSQTYQRFLAQGAPFIGGASGTIEGIALCWETKEKLEDIQGQNERQAEIERREKTIGVYMATLVAGGHHSMSEMLLAAKQFDLFGNVTNPLDNYPLAMKELGEHLARLGLQGNLEPKPGDTWRNALTKVQGEITKICDEVNAYLGGNNSLLANLQGLPDVQEKIEGDFSTLFPDDLDTTLDRVVNVLRNHPRDDQDVADAKQAAVGLIDRARKALGSDLIKGLDKNPFVPVSVGQTLSDALDQVSSVAS